MYQNQKTCQGNGNYNGYPAFLKGSLNIEANYITFEGTIKTSFGTARIVYEGYINMHPYDGFLITPEGTFKIGVIDSVAGYLFRIYEGGISLNAPRIIGEFQVVWN